MLISQTLVNTVGTVVSANLAKTTS